MNYQWSTLVGYEEPKTDEEFLAIVKKYFDKELSLRRVNLFNDTRVAAFDKYGFPYLVNINNRDIVKKLRDVEEFGGAQFDGLWTEAAEEIERLRAILLHLVHETFPPDRTNTTTDINEPDSP